MIRKHLSYANVASTLALVGVIGGGGAYAASKVTSAEIKNNTIRSVDLKNRKAVRGIDVKRNSLAGKQVRERSLNASQFAPLAGSERAGCNPSSAAFVDCAGTTIKLKRRARVLAIATGGQEGEAGPAKAICQVRIDNVPTPLSAAPGEETVENTSLSATNGFARTIVTEPLPPGRHKLALACREFSGDVRISTPTIAAIAINAR